LLAAIAELLIGFWVAGSWRLNATILGAWGGASAFPYKRSEITASFAFVKSVAPLAYDYIIEISGLRPLPSPARQGVILRSPTARGVFHLPSPGSGPPAIAVP
jgi:hypothetical protein